MRPVFWLALLFTLAGCAEVGGPLPDCLYAPIGVTLPVTHVADPRHDWEALLLYENRTHIPGKTELAEVRPVTEGSSFATISLHGSQLKESFVFQHDAVPLTFDDCLDSKTVMANEFRIDSRGSGQVAGVGDGVHAMTAGFWTNGTMFYTNIASLHESNWGRAGWYSYENGDPLRVYVYDESRSERPRQWNVTGPTGGDETVYFTTIEGFNEALKGLSTMTERVVVIPPDQAYTLPGYEAHPLYNETLVFYIRILDVVQIPCPSPTPAIVCDAPVDSSLAKP